MTAPASSTRCRSVREQRQPGSDAVPQLVDVDLEQRSVAVVGRPLPSDVDSAFGHLITDPQSVEGADRVAEQVNPGAFAGWIRLAFDDLNCSFPNRAACEWRRARQCRHRRPELEHRHPAWDFKRLARRAGGLADALVRLAGRRSCHCGVGSRGCRRVGRVRSRSSGSATP